MSTPNYVAALSTSKANADAQVRQEIAAIGKTIQSAAATLQLSGQAINLDIEQITSALNLARDEWLNHMKSVFEGAILAVKIQLQQFH